MIRASGRASETHEDFVDFMWTLCFLLLLLLLLHYYARKAFMFIYRIVYRINSRFVFEDIRLDAREFLDVQFRVLPLSE